MFIGLCLGIASFAFSFAGFGFGLVAVTLLSLVLPVKLAVAIQFPLIFPLLIINTYRYGHRLRLMELKPFFIGAVIALPLGVFALDWFSEIVMKRILAVFTVISVFNSTHSWGKNLLNRFIGTDSGGTILGILSGWFMGAYSAGGPPAVIYATAKYADAEKAKGMMGVYFLLIELVLIVLFCINNVLTAGTLKQSFLHSPAVICGFFLGDLLLERVSHKGYMMGVHFLLLVAAVMLSIPQKNFLQ